jgi:hypothetical protein
MGRSSNNRSKNYKKQKHAGDVIRSKDSSRYCNMLQEYQQNDGVCEKKKKKKK